MGIPHSGWIGLVSIANLIDRPPDGPKEAVLFWKKEPKTF
jgi:hypothetical protein